MSAPRAPDTSLVTGPIGRTLLLFALPLLGSNVLQSLNGSVNAIWVGHYLGEAALAATSNANIILFFLLGIVFGIAMAATILVAQSVGAGRIDQAKRVIGTSAGFFAALSVLVAVCGFLATPFILDAMRAAPEVRPLAIDYLRIIFVALPFLYFSTFVMMTQRGAGDSKTPFWFMLIAVVLDVVLNPPLIFGFGPLPAMGIAGSATATLVAQVLTLGLMIGHIYRRKHFLRLRRGELGYLKPDLVILKSLVIKGIPMGLQMVVMSSSAIVMISLVNGYGAQTTAAYGVASQLWTFVQMPGIAVGAAVSSMAAQNVGAAEWGRVARIARAGIGLSLLMTGIPAVLLYLFAPVVLGLFLPAEGEAIRIAAHINTIVIWSFMFFGVAFVLFGVVRATGAVLPPLVILFVSLWMVRIPLAEMLMPHYGAEAIWWSFPLATFLSMILAGLYYRYGGWRKARMLPASPVGQAPDTSLAAPAVVEVGKLDGRE